MPTRYRRAIPCLLVLPILLLACPADAQRGDRFERGDSLRAGAQEGLPMPALEARPVNGSRQRFSQLVLPNGALIALVDLNSREGGRLAAYLDQVQPRLAERNVGLMVVAFNASQRNTVSDLVQDAGLTVPVAWDQRNEYAEAVVVDAFAMAFVVDPEGLVVNRFDELEGSEPIGSPAVAAALAMVDELEEAREGDAEAAPADDEAGPLSALEVRRRIRRGWLYIQDGFAEAALEDARELHAEQGDLTTTLWLAYVLEVGRVYPEAAVRYRQVLRRDPGHAYARAAVERIDPTGRYTTLDDLDAMPPGATEDPDAAPPAEPEGDG